MRTLGQLIYGDNADKHGNHGVTFRETMNGMRRDSTGAVTWRLGRPGHRIALGPDGITYRKRTYPVSGARAEVNDFRSGLAGRKHTADMTIALASGEVLAWHQTDTGVVARQTHNQVMQFAAAVNSAAAG